MFYTMSQPRAPQWLTLIAAEGNRPAVRALFAPPNRAMRRAAQLAAARVPAIEAEALDGDAAAVRTVDVGDAYARALIRAALIEWEGIGDDDGAPVAVTPTAAVRQAEAGSATPTRGTIDDFLADDRLFDSAFTEFVAPELMREAEKNGLSPSPNGTGAGATPETDTVSSAATPAAARAAKRALTAKATRKPTRALKPGKR